MDRHDPPKHLLDGFPESVLHFVRAMEGNRREVATALGVSEIEIRALFRIAEAGSVIPKQLASDLLVTTGAITGIADRLVDAGLIERTAHPDDRRSIYLELTTVGHREMARMHVDLKTMLSDAANALDPEQVETASHVLTAITASVVAGGQERPPSSL